jgi:hypothetical protein
MSIYTYKKPLPNLSLTEQIEFLENELVYLQRIRDSQRLPVKVTCYKCKKDITGLNHQVCTGSTDFLKNS